jgi:malonyl-CoA O-methyltransferase
MNAQRMDSLGKKRIAAAFGAAHDYRTHARIQRRVAQALADTIAATPIIKARGDQLRLLEIGCGTGLLTEALVERGIGGDWLVTDIAPSMVRRCTEAMTETSSCARMRFAAMDGERPIVSMPSGGFDIICSSLAFQWFEDIQGAIERLAGLLSPGGTLLFTTLMAGTFAEWEAAHSKFGLASGGLAYLGLPELTGKFPKGSLRITEWAEREEHGSAAEFLRSIKRIGAGTAPLARRPLSPRQLRDVMRAFDAQGAITTYQVASCTWSGREMRS